MKTRTKNQTITKVFSLTGELKDNSFEGVAAGIGNLDRGRDVIAPGCFRGLEQDFIRDGSAMKAHAWSDTAIGWIDHAEEQKSGLLVRGTFHSTEKAQEVRTVMAERIAAGKTVGLSIGFRIEDDKWFESGEDLLAFAKGKGITGLDETEIRKCKNYCRLILRAKEIYEVSYAPIPMNAAAMATAVKDVFGGDGSNAPLSLHDHFDAALATVEGMVGRFQRYALRKNGDGNPVNEDRLAEARELHKSLGELIDSVASLKTEEQPEERPVDEAAKSLEEKTLLMRSTALTR